MLYLVDHSHDPAILKMTDDNKVNGTPRTADDPPVKNYQEQPNANAELEKAMDAIPVKDYSDYEITLETKDHYEDALFSDDESLEQALTAPQETIAEKQATAEEKETTPREKSAGENPQAAIKIIDYSDFLTEQSRVGAFNKSSVDESQDTQLMLSETTLNGSTIGGQTPLTIIQETVPEVELDHESETKPDDTPVDAAAHQKILRWGKNRLSQNKAQIEEYLGRTLPERLLPLEFKFSALKPKKEFEHVVSSYEIEKIFTSKGRLLHSLLKQADEDLSTIAKCQLSNKARLQLLDAYTPGLVEKIRGIKGTQGKTPPFPYETNRAIAADHAQNVIKHLISSYKQVYASIYESANHLYAPQRKTANRIAFIILELLCLEQNLLNVLHKPLPVGSPKTFNKIFHVLARYEPEIINLPMISQALEQEVTIKELFLRYQALLSFDLATLSSTLYKSLNHYLDVNLGLLELLSTKDWNTPASFSGKAWMVTHDNNGAPLLASAASSDAFTPVFIRVDIFFNQIKADYAQCLELIGTKTPAHSSSALQPMPLHNSVTLMCQLNSYINMIESGNEPQSYSNYQPWPCKVYSGFAGSYGWLNHYHSVINQPFRKKGEPAAELPKKPSPGATEWRCAMEDDKTFYLQTPERKGTSPLDVGSVVLILLSGEEKTDEVLLLCITRIERIQAGTINLVAEKLGQQSINSVLCNTSGDKTPGIISCLNEQRFLLANPKEKFWTGKNLEAILPDRTRANIQIKGIKYLSQQIQVLELE